MAVNVKQMRENRCPDCAGLGSNNDHDHCETCHGTGYIIPEAPTHDPESPHVRFITECVAARSSIEEAVRALELATPLLPEFTEECRQRSNNLNYIARNIDRMAISAMRAMRAERSNT